MATQIGPGAIVGRYEIGHLIGQGAMGIVYEALDRSLGRRVALKVLHAPPTDAAASLRAAERFLREGRAAAQVRHTHVVDVYDYGVEHGLPFLVMELIEGESLAQLLRRMARLPVERAVDTLLPVLSAVGELHAAGIVHRDIKPANILLARGSGYPKLADFGVSRFDDGSPSITQSGVIVGTPAYMPPELLRAKGSATERSDQYALGVTLYECVTGDKPFRGATDYELMHAVVTSAVRLPSSIEPSLPGALDEVVLRAMHRDPERRFASVDELAESLLPFATESARARWRSEFEPADPSLFGSGMNTRAYGNLEPGRFCAVLVGRAFLVSWLSSPDAESVLRIVAALPAARAAAGAQLVYCTYVPEGVGPPSAAVRRLILDVTPTMLESCTCIHTVQSAVGPIAFAFRAAARAMVIAGGYGGKAFIHSSLGEFLASGHHELGVPPSVVRSEIERMVAWGSAGDLACSTLKG